MKRQAKPWYRSRTLWINAVAAGLVMLEAKTDALQPLLPVNFYAALSVLLPVMNAVLRCVTTQGIARINPAPPAKRSRNRKDAPIQRDAFNMAMRHSADGDRATDGR